MSPQGWVNLTGPPGSATTGRLPRRNRPQRSAKQARAPGRKSAALRGRRVPRVNYSVGVVYQNWADRIVAWSRDRGNDPRGLRHHPRLARSPAGDHVGGAPAALGPRTGKEERPSARATRRGALTGRDHRPQAPQAGPRLLVRREAEGSSDMGLG